MKRKSRLFGLALAALAALAYGRPVSSQDSQERREDMRRAARETSERVGTAAAVESLERRLAALESRVARLEGRPDPHAPPDPRE